MKTSCILNNNQQVFNFSVSRKVEEIAGYGKYPKGKDPNSKLAHKKVNKNSKRELIKQALSSLGEATEREIFQHLIKFYSDRFESKTDVSRRTSEMIADGTIVKVGNKEERGSQVRVLKLNNSFDEVF